MLAAAAVFAVALFVTRLIQNWLGARLLPQTRLDAGVSNSISTIFGYVGVDRRRCCWRRADRPRRRRSSRSIAGALSVGIGFGLQTIANNFVSGLILLWERGIRVGDWVVVGAEQGFVRRINARATEIETFDRGDPDRAELESGQRRGQELGPQRPGRAGSSSRSTSPTRATSSRCATC